MFIFLSKTENVDIFERLVLFRLPLLITHLIAGFFLIAVISYFFYKPFKKWFKGQEEHFSTKQSLINENLKKTETLKKQRIEDLKKSQLFIDSLMLKSKQEMISERQKILQSAKKEKKQIIDDAHSISEQKKKSLEKEINDSVVQNSVLLAKKILNSEINMEKHQNLIEEFIKELEKKNAKK